MFQSNGKKEYGAVDSSFGIGLVKGSHAPLALLSNNIVIGSWMSMVEEDVVLFTGCQTTAPQRRYVSKIEDVKGQNGIVDFTIGVLNKPIDSNDLCLKTIDIATDAAKVNNSLAFHHARSSLDGRFEFASTTLSDCDFNTGVSSNERCVKNVNDGTSCKSRRFSVVTIHPSGRLLGFAHRPLVEPCVANKFSEWTFLEITPIQRFQIDSFVSKHSAQNGTSRQQRSTKQRDKSVLKPTSTNDAFNTVKNKLLDLKDRFAHVTTAKFRTNDNVAQTLSSFRSASITSDVVAKRTSSKIIPVEMKDGEFSFLAATSYHNEPVILFGKRSVVAQWPILIFTNDIAIGSANVNNAQYRDVVITEDIRGELLYDVSIGLLNKDVELNDKTDIAKISLTIPERDDPVFVLSWLLNKAYYTEMRYIPCDTNNSSLFDVHCVGYMGEKGPCHLRTGDVVTNGNGEVLGFLRRSLETPCVVNPDALWSFVPITADQFAQMQEFDKRHANESEVRKLALVLDNESSFSRSQTDTILTIDDESPRIVSNRDYVSRVASDIMNEIRNVELSSEFSSVHSNAISTLKTGEQIINGSKADLGQFPYAAALVDEDTNRIFCSGVIITSRVILSAGHCAEHVDDDSLVSVRVGAVKHRGGYLYDIESYIAQNEPDGPINDIALFITEDFIEFSDLVGRLALPKKTRDYTEVKMIVVGWGQRSDGKVAKRLMYTDTYGVPQDDCAIRDDRVLCIHNNRSSACYGDSGAPVIFQRSNGKRELAALIQGTIGNNCEANVYGGIFTVRVRKYVKWIKSLLQYNNLGYLIDDEENDDEEDENNDNEFKARNENQHGPQITLGYVDGMSYKRTILRKTSRDEL